MKYLMMIAIRLYQIVFPPLRAMLGLSPSCRFTPTCSNYWIEALKKHGAWRGMILGVKRLGLCHPWSKSHGYDPVPEPSWVSKVPTKKNEPKIKVW